MSLSCIIIDDEPNAVNLLEILIQDVTTWQLSAKCYDALEALAFLKEHPVDFVFLDINMPKLSGMELAGLLPPGIQIVFTTAYSEYAAESYTYQTIDYLLKPVTLKRFLSAVQKIELHFVKFKPATPTEPAVSTDYFFIKSGKVFSKIFLGDILYFQGEKEYVRLVTVREEIMIYRRLKDIEAQLTLPFLRIHNSFIVNLKQLDKIQDNHVYISNKRIPVSDGYRVKFMAIIDKRQF